VIETKNVERSPQGRPMHIKRLIDIKAIAVRVTGRRSGA